MSSPVLVVPYIPDGLNGLLTRGKTIKFMDFETYWQLIEGDAKFADRKTATEELWNAHPEKHQGIIQWLRKRGAYKKRNPYFFILDWEVKEAKSGPTNYNGRALPKVPVFSAKYNGQWGMYTQADIDKYGLERASS